MESTHIILPATKHSRKLHILFENFQTLAHKLRFYVIVKWTVSVRFFSAPSSNLACLLHAPLTNQGMPLNVINKMRHGKRGLQPTSPSRSTFSPCSRFADSVFTQPLVK